MAAQGLTVSEGSETNITPEDQWISQHSRWDDDVSSPHRAPPTYEDEEDLEDEEEEEEKGRNQSLSEVGHFTSNGVQSIGNKQETQDHRLDDILSQLS